MSESGPRHPVKTARTTFEILEILKEEEGATVTEVADRFDLSKSSVHNYLSTLEHEGYVVKYGDTYDVGLGLLDLGGYARDRSDLYHAAREELRPLQRDTGGVTYLTVEEHGRGYILYRAYGQRSAVRDSYTGQRVHLHNTAAGKAILAHLPADRVDEILDQHGLPATTDNTITDRGRLLEELREIRDEAVALDHEERVEGLRSIAVPLLNRRDLPRGAVGITSPASRTRGDRFREKYLQQLRSAASVIQLQL